MKKIIAILGILFIGVTGFAQNKNARATIEVDGVCGMCKERIEKASIQAKGVKSANWNVETHQLDQNSTKHCRYRARYTRHKGKRRSL